MTAATPDAAAPTPRVVRGRELLGPVIALLIVVAGLTWAKWSPYGARVETLAHTRHWGGGAIFAAAGASGAAPSWQGVMAFTWAYVRAVWKAALVAVLIAAALETLVPRRWLMTVLARRRWWSQGVGAGLLAMPSMMCSCCTAPVAIGLRRRGAPAGAVMAYWLANPLLNPAVVVFLLLVMPWPYAATRVLVGVLAVLGAAFIADRTTSRPVDLPTVPAEDAADPDRDPASLALAYARSLRRYVLVVLPEYLIMVVLMGALSAPLASLLQPRAGVEPLVLLGVVVVGLALMIPTGGEIPVVAGLAAAGAAPGIAGALLVALPAVSIPSIVMVARRFPARALVGVLAWLAVCCLLSAALLASL